MPLKGFPLFVASFVICVCVCIFFLSFFHFYMRFFFLFFLYKKYPLTNYNNTENTQYCFVRLRQIPSFVLDAFFLFKWNIPLKSFVTVNCSVLFVKCKKTTTKTSKTNRNCIEKLLYFVRNLSSIDNVKLDNMFCDRNIF